MCPLGAGKRCPWLFIASHGEQITGFGLSRCGASELAGGDTRQCGEVTPAEGGPGAVKLVPAGLVILLGMQRAVFADGMTQQDLKDGIG